VSETSKHPQNVVIFVIIFKMIFCWNLCTNNVHIYLADWIHFLLKADWHRYSVTCTDNVFRCSGEQAIQCAPTLPRRPHNM